MVGTTNRSMAAGREFAAWLGLVPRQNSTGGKTRLGGITKRGNRYLRRLLINGASANLLRSKATKADPWVIGLRRRRPPLVVAVALEGKRSLLIVLQGLDAAGKDGVIRHVISGTNPQGVNVTRFQQPAHEELAHDFLWRAHRHAPA